MVQFAAHASGRYIVYTISVENVRLRVRYPRYIHAAKKLFGDAGELICEDLLQQGQSLMSQVRETLDAIMRGPTLFCAEAIS